MNALTTLQMLEKWEDQREIKNLMGKVANCILLNRESELTDRFWSRTREDVCLGLNDGWYIGLPSVRAYYQAEHDRCALVADCLQKAYPHLIGDQSAEEIYGIGVFKAKPLYAPVIEVADDCETAKGLWYCMGTSAKVDAAGPVADWTWGYYCVDFVREDEQWRIWHMQYLNDIECISGQSWGKERQPYPELEEFLPLKSFHMPQPDVPCCLRPYYSPLRPLTLSPQIPEPYHTFSETFSYGAEV